ncbi:MAG: dicarboxylate/amino acid:cation symporter [Gammaproteobacteria bacterium]|nr:dicarboxylate/amino acid:cation symporter [Gammaproteobacteria bacterium]
MPLWQRILPAMFLGIVVGWLWPASGDYIGWVGEIFVRLIRMVVVPLVFVTVVAGVASLDSIRDMGSIGLRALGMFIGLSVVAGCVGVALAVAVQPGRGASLEGLASAPGIAGRSLPDQLLGIIPVNPVAALANGDMLAVIFFAIVIGAGILSAGSVAQPIKALFASATGVMSRVITGVLETAPLGVFALVATAVGKGSSLSFMNISLLAICVLLGSLIESLLIHSALIRFVARLPVLRFFGGATDALLIAFSTGSSSATLPAAIVVAERNFGLHKSVSSTVLPIGASIGRDGTAMYVGLLAVFASQAFGLPLELKDYATIVVATSLVALGTAPVPSASLFMLAAVLSTIGIPDSSTAIIVALILPFDSVLNMVRTVPNATCNLAVAVTTARFENAIDEQVFAHPPRL